MLLKYYKCLAGSEIDGFDTNFDWDIINEKNYFKYSYENYHLQVVVFDVESHTLYYLSGVDLLEKLKDFEEK